MPSFQLPVGDEDKKRCPTECVTSEASCFQLSAGDANIFPTEYVATTVPSLEPPVGDKNINRSTGCLISESSCFQLSASDENANIFPTEYVATTVPSLEPPVGDKNINRSTGCLISESSCFQLSAGDENANIFPTEYVATRVPSLEPPVGDKNTNRSAGWLISEASCFQLSAGDESARKFPTGCVASTVPSLEPPVGDKNIHRSAGCVTSEASCFQLSATKCVASFNRPAVDENVNRSPAECVPSAASSLSTITCPYCAKCFQRPSHLNRHISVFHTTNKPFECQQCAKKFSTEKQYNVHIRRHENKCPYCTEVFRVRKDLLKHVVLCHKDRDPSSLVRDAKRYSQGKFSCGWGQGGRAPLSLLYWSPPVDGVCRLSYLPLFWQMR